MSKFNAPHENENIDKDDISFGNENFLIAELDDEKGYYAKISLDPTEEGDMECLLEVYDDNDERECVKVIMEDEIEDMSDFQLLQLLDWGIRKIRRENMENATELTEDEMKDELYRLYQLDWMMEHHASIDEIFQILKDVAADLDDYDELEANVDMMIDGFYRHGFDGQVFACFDDFCDTELGDKEYIKELLDRVDDREASMLADAYVKYRKRKSEED